MSEVLSLSQRPRSFGELVGQKSAIGSIMEQVGSGRVPRAWLLVGQAGNGKTTTARIMALSFQGDLKDFGSPSEEAWGKYNDYSIHEINGSDINGVDDLRKVAEESFYLPAPPSKRRVYIIDEAQRITEAAQNLLLKPVEEPPKSTVWIFCTTDPRKILTAIKQRCFRVALAPLGDNGMMNLLTRAAKTIKCKKPLEDLVEQLNVAGISSPRAVLMSLEAYASGKSAQAAVMSGDAEVDTLRICRAFVRGDWDTIRKDLKQSSPEEARLIRLAVVGYLRAILLSDSPSIPPARLGAAIIALTTLVPFDASAELAWTAAVLRQEARKFREGA